MLLGYSELTFGEGMHGAMSQRHSMDFDPSRSHSASNLQNFYASQRYQGRQSEAEQVLQAKRRMAAQRERELRNYHQEQQFNRSESTKVLIGLSCLTNAGVLAEMSSSKSDRSMSPSTMSEEGRRELLARQHRALYGNEASNFLPQGGFGEEGSSGRDAGSNVPTTGAGGMRGTSPRTADPFGMGQVSGQQGSVDKANPTSSMSNQEMGRTETAKSPALGTAPAQFGKIDTSVQQTGNSSNSPAGGESPNRSVAKAPTAPIGSGMGPIGTRLPQQQQPSQQPHNQSLNKRSTTPLTSPMNNFGFGSSEQASNNERSGSSNSNPQPAQKETSSGMGAWGTGSGVWGSNKIGATSVWG